MECRCEAYCCCAPKCEACEKQKQILWMLEDAGWHRHKELEKAMDEYVRTKCDNGIHTLVEKIKKKSVGNGKPKGQFAGTLTKSTTDEVTLEDMETAIRKIMSQKTCPVKRYAWYVEFTKSDVPHIHFIYETESGGRIHQKVFKRYWKSWDESVRQGAGFRGGYHKTVDSEVAYTEYIAKDANIKSENKW